MSDSSLANDQAVGFDSFRASVLDYLLAEWRLVKEDISAHADMAPDEKERLGLLVRNATLLRCGDDASFSYETPNNFTKLRPGDRVRIVEPDSAGDGIRAIVDENAIDRMSFTLESPGNLQKSFTRIPAKADIVVNEQNNLDTLRSVAEDIVDGSRGLYFLRMLGGFAAPKEEGRFGRIEDLDDSEIPESFNAVQRSAVHMAMRRPSLAFVQGTPGSGKTHLLAVVARAYARRGKDVVVLALTHHAVNNALNKVRSVDKDIPIVKIGKHFKNLDLEGTVVQDETFSVYLQKRKEAGFFGEEGHVVGMTFQAALTNLGKRRSAFTPQIVLFDEAGQIPLAHAAAVGQLGGGSVVFIGDDAQMPPIYHPKLTSDPLSISVFERIKALYPTHGRVLNVTYRMNKRITRFVGDCFYRPRGIELECSEFSARRHIDDPEIEFVVCSLAGSTDENAVEARKAVDIANKYLDSGLPFDRLAIITPYRHQVRLIHKMLNESRPNCSDIPLVDTVERLQGQDVDVIILSFAVDDEVYFAAQKSFLMNRNRLNVMFSRATSKVVVISSRLVQDEVRAIWAKAVKSRPGGSCTPASFHCGKSASDA